MNQFRKRRIKKKKNNALAMRVERNLQSAVKKDSSTFTFGGNFRQ